MRNIIEEMLGEVDLNNPSTPLQEWSLEHPSTLRGVVSNYYRERVLPDSIFPERLEDLYIREDTIFFSVLKTSLQEDPLNNSLTSVHTKGYSLPFDEVIEELVTLKEMWELFQTSQGSLTPISFSESPENFLSGPTGFLRGNESFSHFEFESLGIDPNFPGRTLGRFRCYTSPTKWIGSGILIFEDLNGLILSLGERKSLLQAKPRIIRN